MRPVQKVLTTILWGLTVLAMVSVIGAGLWRRGAGDGGGISSAEGIAISAEESGGDDLAPLAAVPAFSFMDQNGKTITADELKGEVWLADFIFTRCAGPCSMMTSKMASMQASLPPAVKLVSFSVDPDYDTPGVLKEYAKIFKADESRWHFLTGDKSAIYAQARGMLLTAIPASETNAIIHDERFLLIDHQGQIRGAYHSKDEAQMAKLIAHAARLADEAKESGK